MNVVKLQQPSTGVGDLALPSLAPYPVPFTDELIVPLTQLASVTVRDALGRTVSMMDPTTLSTRLDTRHWPPGIYHVETKGKTAMCVKR